MPYVTCPECQLTVFSVAGHSTRDSCCRCSAPLPVALASKRRRRAAAARPDRRPAPSRPIAC